MNTTYTQRNGREPVVLDGALSGLARIGAESVPGIRVLSTQVNKRTVCLDVDVECRENWPEIVREARDRARARIDKDLPYRKHTHVRVTVANLRPPADTRGRVLWHKSMGVLKRELGPWIVPLLVLLAGVIILWIITRSIENITVGDVVLASLLIMPILIYAILSGKLTEIRGPGGLEARFAAEATTPVAGTVSHDSVSVDELLTVSPDTGLGQLEKRVQRFTETDPIVLTITIGANSRSMWSGDEHRESLKAYVAELSRSRNFALVAFLDTDNNFVAYMPSWVFKNRLDDDEQARELLGVIGQADTPGFRQKLFEYPGILRDTVSPSATNGEALRRMVASDLDLLVVVDENNRLKGVVERGQVLSRMLLALTPNS